MRIATSTLFDRGLAAIDQAQRNLAKSQTEVSTGRRVNTASDDPIAASAILRTTSSLANNSQYMTNQNAANALLGQTDETLGQVGDVLQTVRTTLVSANNGALSDSERQALGTELKSRLDSLVALANTKDGNGQYLFAGYRSNTSPFTNNGTSVTYSGDDGTRNIQVSATRQISVSASGSSVFGRVAQGNGVFTTAAGSANTGTGIVDTGQVTNPSALTGHSYDVQFAVANGATTYSVLDTTTNTSVSTGNTFTPGSAVSFGGVQFSISGTPADGDHFSVAPAGKQSMFQTLQDAAALLMQPTRNAAGIAKLSSTMLGAISNVDNAINNTLSVRASVGVRQNELDALTSASQQNDTDGSDTLSKLRDTDYAKSISDLTKGQTALSAAQKVFATINNKTLFDYL